VHHRADELDSIQLVGESSGMLDSIQLVGESSGMLDSESVT
jgi:hypothetical protein